MSVIAIAQLKGGVGKTTIAVNLAGELVRMGRTVTLYDADPQESAVEWADQRKLDFEVRPHTLRPLQGPMWMREILKARADVVIVDLAAGLGDAFDAALLVADLVIVPCRPSGLDLAAVARTLDHVKDRLRRNAELSFGMLFVPASTDAVSEESQQIAGELAALGQPVGPGLPYDLAFVRAFSRGVTVGQLAPDGQADVAVRSLAQHVVRQLGLGRLDRAQS